MYQLLCVTTFLQTYYCSCFPDIVVQVDNSNYKCERWLSDQILGLRCFKKTISRLSFGLNEICMKLLSGISSAKIAPQKKSSYIQIRFGNSIKYFTGDTQKATLLEIRH